MYNDMPELSTKQEEWERGYCAQVLRGEIMWELKNAGVSASEQKDTRDINVDRLEHDKRRIPTVVKHLRAQGYFTVSCDESNFDKVYRTAQKWEAAPKFKCKGIAGGKALKNLNELYEPLSQFNDAEIIYLFYHRDAFDVKYMEVTRERHASRQRYGIGSKYHEKFQEWRAYPTESLGAADMLLYEGQIEACVLKNLPRVIRELSGLPIDGENISTIEPKDLKSSELSWQVTYHLGQARKSLKQARDFISIRKYVRRVAKEVQDDQKIYPVILSRMSALVKKRAPFYALDKKDDSLSRLAKTALQSGWVG